MRLQKGTSCLQSGWLNQHEAEVRCAFVTAEGVRRAEQLLRHMTGKADFTRSGRTQNVERCVAAQEGTMVINLGL